MQLPSVLWAHGHPASLGGLSLHCCPAKRGWQHKVRACSQQGKALPHCPPPGRLSSSPLLLFQRVPAPALGRGALTYPFSRRTILTWSPLWRHKGSGQGVGMASKHTHGASQVEDSPHHQSLLLAQAHPGSQERPARHRDANKKSDGAAAKPCTLAELWASFASKPRLEQRSSSSHREQRMFRHFLTHLLSRVARNPLSARLSIIPRFPLHKNTRHHQDCIQQWISAPRGFPEPQCTPRLSQGCGVSMPADPSLLHSQ